MDAMNNPIVQEDMAYIQEKMANPACFVGMDILITGCGGFIGFYLTHLFVHLKRQGYAYDKLLLLDTFRSGIPEWLSRLTQEHQDIEAHTFDIARDSLELVQGAESADYVFHMASIASPTFYRQFPVETIEANVMGLQQLLDFYKHRPLKGLLFFSSSEIYGDPNPDSIPTPESYWGHVASIGPRACYDESKRMGETLCYVYHQTFGMPVRVVRPFNNFGPGMSLTDRRLPADFALAVLRNEPIVIHSDGKPTRTFCYIADAIDGYLRVLLHDEFDFFNIGMDGGELSVEQLAGIYREAAAELQGYTGDIHYTVSPEKDYLLHNPSRRCPDLSKARGVLGYRPEIEVSEGVRRYLTFLQKELISV